MNKVHAPTGGAFVVELESTADPKQRCEETGKSNMAPFNTVRVDLGKIRDWDDFHDVFADAMGFPGFYGRNMDAWIDCMTYLDGPEDGMTEVHAPPGGVFVLELENMADLKQRCAEIHDALVECSAFVNWRRMEKGEPPVLVLSYYG